MINKVIFGFLAFFVLLAPSAARAAGSSDDNAVIGTILEVQGRATVEDAMGSHAAAVNGEIHMNDLVSTGPDSHVFILLIDNTEWTLDQNSKFKVDEYVFDPDDGSQNKARYSVLQGAIDYVSGLVAHARPDPDVKISSPVGSIGIRGTDMWCGEIDGQYGVMVKEGKVDVNTMAGSTTVRQGMGTFIANRNSRPTSPHVWGQAKMDKIRALIDLKDQMRIRSRVQNMQSRQLQLRQKLKAVQDQRREKLQDRRQDRQQKMQDQRQQRREQLQDRMQDRMQDRRGKWRQGRNDDDDDNDGTDLSAEQQQRAAQRQAVIQSLRARRTGRR
ncbi:MAG: hypothetical protein GC185_05985 [Alphaproteobacteria bacterium]|nr:hypothetical protein [Alphaproteobacteria bacterium]